MDALLLELFPFEKMMRSANNNDNDRNTAMYMSSSNSNGENSLKLRAARNPTRSWSFKRSKNCGCWP